jgi:hypothetical protein
VPAGLIAHAWPSATNVTVADLPGAVAAHAGSAAPDASVVAGEDGPGLMVGCAAVAPAEDVADRAAPPLESSVDEAGGELVPDSVGAHADVMTTTVASAARMDPFMRRS